MRGKDAGSGRIRSDTAATEDAASRRPARPGGTAARLGTGSVRNLAGLAEQTLERHGDHESLFFEGEWHKSARLHERARRLAQGLRDVGVEPGDRVVVLMANCPEVGIAYNALWRVGAVVTPAIFLLPPPELRHIVDDSEARVVITTPEFGDTAREAAPDARVISTEEFAELESGGESPIVERADDDLAALMYTGGTTG
ncbi:MAG TPA: AMP-binding protein, partial [Gaiellaceae bacterium]|nr:AMP-binding protein [Gaiellaceae bacterium]